MPLVQVWKCARTGRLYEDKAKYRRHLRRQVKVRAFERECQRIDALIGVLHECWNVAEMQAWFDAHGAEVWSNLNARHASQFYYKEKQQILSIKTPSFFTILRTEEPFGFIMDGGSGGGASYYIQALGFKYVGGDPPYTPLRFTVPENPFAKFNIWKKLNAA